jgi:hypothetical protein
MPDAISDDDNNSNGFANGEFRKTMPKPELLNSEVKLEPELVEPGFAEVDDELLTSIVSEKISQKQSKPRPQPIEREDSIVRRKKVQ